MSASSAPGQSKSSPKSHATPIVFVVDDDISVRESLELLIRSEGWQPETFEAAQEFLAHPRALVPSCLVLDVSLPGLNGLELQKRVAFDRTDMPFHAATLHWVARRRCRCFVIAMRYSPVAKARSWRSWSPAC